MTSRRSRARVPRLLGLLLLLPALVCGPVLGGAVVWLHAHGDAGGHVHMLAAAHVGSEHGSHDAWHAAQHAREHGGDGHRHAGDSEERGPRGVRVEFPEVLEVATVTGAVAATHLPSMDARQPMLPAFLVARAVSADTPAPPDRPPPSATGRSAVAELIRSSHALLF